GRDLDLVPRRWLDEFEEATRLRRPLHVAEPAACIGTIELGPELAIEILVRREELAAHIEPLGPRRHERVLAPAGGKERTRILARQIVDREGLAGAVEVIAHLERVVGVSDEARRPAGALGQGLDERPRLAEEPLEQPARAPRLASAERPALGRG